MIKLSKFIKLTAAISRLTPWLVLFVGFIVTYLAWEVSYNQAQSQLRIKFDQEVKQIHSIIQERMKAQEQVLLSTRGLFSSSNSVERHEFRNFVDGMQLSKNYPGIQGVGFSLAIKPKDLSRHIASIRKEGFPDYSVKPAGNRNSYTSIIYLEPFDWRNQRAFGFDMLNEPVRRSAMERARDSAEAKITGKVTLVQEAGASVQPGFLMYVPVYRNGLPHQTLEARRANLVGWVYSPFRMYDLMNATLGSFDPNLDIHIYDGNNVSNDALMYDSLGPTESHIHGSFASVSTLAIDGQDWTIEVRSLPLFHRHSNFEEPVLVGAAGIVITLLLATITQLLVRGREKALAAKEVFEYQAHTDYLTKLNNRGHFLELAELERARAIRYGSTLSLLMVDIDFFKHVNDTYGHKAGDDVLRQFSAVCQSALRRSRRCRAHGG